MAPLPSVFVSHGAPDTAIADTAAARFMAGFANQIDRPKAIVVASAHFEVEGSVGITIDEKPEMIHDFGGFDRRLYEMRYNAPGAPDLAGRIIEMLGEAGFMARPQPDRGFDHGTWVPLSLIYPRADIPVVQVSIDPTRDAAYHLSLGQALAPLRGEGVLIVGSGSFTHNLGEAFKAVRSGQRDADMPDWVAEFVSWMDERIQAGALEDLADYRRRAPHAVQNHPTDEHLMPLYVAIGAALGEDGALEAEAVHRSHEFSVLSMDAYRFS
jgi:4,5-DOPA dioxygenase extradiol